MLELRNLSSGYGAIEALKGINIRIEKSEIVGSLSHGGKRAFRRAYRGDRAAELLETERQRGPNIFFVVDDERSELRRSLR